MIDHLQRPAAPETRSNGGEGGNHVTAPRPNALLVAALLFSAIFVVLATAALH